MKSVIKVNLLRGFLRAAFVAGVAAFVAFGAGGCHNRLNALDAMTPDSLLNLAEDLVGDTVLVRGTVLGVSTDGRTVRLGERRSPIVLRVKAPERGEFEAGDAGEMLLVRGKLCELRTSRQALVGERRRLEDIANPDHDQMAALNEVSAKIAYMELEHRDYSVEYFLQGIDVEVE